MHFEQKTWCNENEIKEGILNQVNVILIRTGFIPEHGSDPRDYLAEHSYYNTKDYRCDTVM